MFLLVWTYCVSLRPLFMSDLVCMFSMKRSRFSTMLVLLWIDGNTSWICSWVSSAATQSLSACILIIHSLEVVFDLQHHCSCFKQGVDLILSVFQVLLIISCTPLFGAPGLNTVTVLLLNFTIYLISLYSPTLKKH